MTRIAKTTVMRLLLEVRDVCAQNQVKVFRDLSCRRLQPRRNVGLDLLQRAQSGGRDC